MKKKYPRMRYRINLSLPDEWEKPIQELAKQAELDPIELVRETLRRTLPELNAATVERIRKDYEDAVTKYI